MASFQHYGNTRPDREHKCFDNRAVKRAKAALTTVTIHQ